MPTARRAIFPFLATPPSPSPLHRRRLRRPKRSLIPSRSSFSFRISFNEKTTIVIPVLNEEEALRRTLDRLEQFPEVEMIVVDGGSTDETVPLLQSWSDRHSDQTRIVLYGERGRARQMNAGAKRATERSSFFFMPTPPSCRSDRCGCGSGPLACRGRRRFSIADRFQPFLLRVVGKLANLRSRLFTLPYGDQGFFVRRDLFERLGDMQRCLSWKMSISSAV